MNALRWLLVHYGTTVGLAGLERGLRAELAQRAACALGGVASPQQRPPWEVWLAAAMVLLVVWRLVER